MTLTRDEAKLLLRHFTVVGGPSLYEAGMTDEQHMAAFRKYHDTVVDLHHRIEEFAEGKEIPKRDGYQLVLVKLVSRGEAA